MSPIAKIAIAAIMATTALGCHAPTVAIQRPLLKPAKPKVSYVNIATVRPEDEKLVRDCLAANDIDDIATVERSHMTFVSVPPAEADRARNLVKSDSKDKGYWLLGQPLPSPKVATATPSDQFVSVGSVADTDRQAIFYLLKKNGISAGGLMEGGESSIIVAPESAEKARTLINREVRSKGLLTPDRIPEQVTRSLPAKRSTEFLTLTTVADKDAPTVLATLKENQIPVAGTWQSKGAAGIVIAEGDLAKARAVIQQDAKKRGYKLYDPSARPASQANPPRTKGAPTIKHEDREVLVATVRAKDADSAYECLSTGEISYGASVESGLCRIYVSSPDSDRASVIIHEDAFKKGYKILGDKLATLAR